MVLAASVVGCESMGGNTKKGAGLGALAGATVGGIVGHQGAMDGKALLLVEQLELFWVEPLAMEADKRQLEVNKDHITIIQIAEMGQKGIPEDVIISEIDRTHSEYTLTSGDNCLFKRQ